MRRFLAILAVGGMIAAALIARSAIDSDGGGGTGSGPAASGGDASLVCDDTLADICEMLASDFDDLDIQVVDLEAGRAIFDSADLTTGQDQPDGWLTLAPLPAQVDESRERSGSIPVFADHEPIGRSPLVVAIWNDRAAALESACGGPINWRCIGDNADVSWADLDGDTRWGRLTPGIDDPATNATGLLVTGQAAVSFMTTPDFASNDFDTSGLRIWLNNLLDAVPPPPPGNESVLDRMLSAGPSSYDLVGTTEAAATGRIAVSRDKDQLTVIYPVPMASADVVLAPVDGAAGADRLIEIAGSAQMAAAISAAGFLAPDEAVPADGTPLADDNGLPRPGVLDALADL